MERLSGERKAGSEEGVGGVLATNPLLKYTGFSLLLAWHYTLWFVPHSFASVPLLDDRVTYSWLVNLGSTVVFLLLIALLLGRKRRLSSCRWLRLAAPALMCIGTLLLSLWAVSLETPFLAYAIALLLGPAEAALWILWGERYACIKANFSIRHIGTVFGITLIVCMAIAWALPRTHRACSRRCCPSPRARCWSSRSATASAASRCCCPSRRVAAASRTWPW